jgi:hypothetical protein
VGVESTPRHAHEDGSHVSLLPDAMTDPHEHSASRISPHIAETETTAKLLQLLGKHRR